MDDPQDQPPSPNPLSPKSHSSTKEKMSPADDKRSLRLNLPEADLQSETSSPRSPTSEHLFHNKRLSMSFNFLKSKGKKSETLIEEKGPKAETSRTGEREGKENRRFSLSGTHLRQIFGAKKKGETQSEPASPKRERTEGESSDGTEDDEVEKSVLSPQEAEEKEKEGSTRKLEEEESKLKECFDEDDAIDEVDNTKDDDQNSSNPGTARRNRVLEETTDNKSEEAEDPDPIPQTKQEESTEPNSLKYETEQVDSPPTLRKKISVPSLPSIPTLSDALLSPLKRTPPPIPNKNLKPKELLDRASYILRISDLARSFEKQSQNQTETPRKDREDESTLSEEELQKKAEKIRIHRNNIAKEILGTEEVYVSNLRAVIEYFLNPLRRNNNITEENLKIIFSDIEIILAYNSRFLDQLRPRVENWSDNQTLGDVFLNITKFLKVYTQYVSSFTRALAMLSQVRKESKIGQMLKEMEESPQMKGLDLAAYLILPVQRIPRYEMLLADLLRHTGREHADYENLESAAKQIKEVASYVNEKKREADNIKMVSELQDLFGGKIQELALPHRRFVKQGNLLHHVAKNKIPKKKERIIILFNDMIVIASNLPQDRFFNKGAIYKHEKHYPLSGTTTIFSLDCPEPMIEIINESLEEKHLSLSSKDTIERDEWVTAIQTVVDELRNKIRDEPAPSPVLRKKPLNAAASKNLAGRRTRSYTQIPLNQNPLK